MQGVLIKEGDPLVMRSMGGITQIVPASRVARRRMPESLMMSTAQLRLTPQDVADLRGIPAERLKGFAGLLHTRG